MIKIFTGSQMRYLNFEMQKDLLKQQINYVEIFDFSQNSDYIFFFDSLQSNTLFGEVKLIIGRRIDKIKKVSEFINLLEKVSHTKNVVLLEGSGDIFTVKQKDKLEKFIELEESKEKSLTKYFLEKYKNNLKCSEIEALKIISSMPEDYYLIMNTLHKLEIFFSNDKFNIDIAISLVATKEQEIFYYIEEYIFKKNFKDLINFLHKEKQYMLFLSLLTDEVLMYKILKEFEKYKNISFFGMKYSQFSKQYASELSRIFYKHPFLYFKKLEYLDYVTIEKLSLIMDEILECELSIKSGKMNDSIAVYQLVCHINNVGGFFER